MPTQFGSGDQAGNHQQPQRPVQVQVLADADPPCLTQQSLGPRDGAKRRCRDKHPAFRFTTRGRTRSLRE